MVWWPFFFACSVLGVSGTSLHFLSHGYVELERQAVVGVNDAWGSMVDWTATSLGYELPKPAPVGMRELTPAEEIERAALAEGISTSLARAQYKKEGSRGNPRAVSPKGAIGLMQIMPATGLGECGLTKDELFDPHKNARCGFRYLKSLIKKYGDIRLALLHYNGGKDAVRVVEDCKRNVPCMQGYDESYYYARDILLWSAMDIRG